MSSIFLCKTEPKNLVNMLCIIFAHFFQIFMDLSLTWITGFVAWFTDLQVFWYLFTILTSSHGVLIFLAFTCKARIWKLWSNLLNGRKDTVSSSSTFLTRVKISSSKPK